MQLDLKQLQQQYDQLKSLNLNLDLTRGKPSSKQVQLSDALDGILEGDYLAADGTDTRNYGGIRGIPEARALGAVLLDVPSENVICGGNSSLQLMHTTLNTIVNYGLLSVPTKMTDGATILCPVPGYDRHFTLTHELGLRMQTVRLLDDGPDMDQVEELVYSDRGICGIWCVPKHSNPTGITYSENTISRLVRLATSRSGDSQPFFILWDNAYAVHDFNGITELPSIFSHAQGTSAEHRLVLFASTSKITHAGAGIAFLGGSTALLIELEKHLATMTVGPDKVNQLRHAKFLRDANGIQSHMQAHAELLRPKFEQVDKSLTQHLGNTGLASWTKPTGGYFVSMDLKPGLAQQTVALAKEAGLALTPAGATFPYGKDPTDSNLRLAPTFGHLKDLDTAVTILSISCRLAAASQ